jgi:hypothetical protein
MFGTRRMSCRISPCDALGAERPLPEPVVMAATLPPKIDSRTSCVDYRPKYDRRRKTMMHIIYEVCLDDPEGVAWAADAGAASVELCANLAQGGTTPTVGSVGAALEMAARTGMGVKVMLRPRPGEWRLAPVGLLAELPPTALERARWWERHILEVEIGRAPDAGTARADYEPTQTTLAQRDAAKAAELTVTGIPAGGTPLTARTVRRLRLRYRAQGLLGLLDRRSIRPATPLGRLDPRVVAAARTPIVRETARSTGTKARLWRVVQAALAAEYGEGEVPLPSQRTFERLVEPLAAGQHTSGPATSRRTQASRPQGPFTPTAASRPGRWCRSTPRPWTIG